MSVIQQIQEKYAKVMAVIIALALVIFVVMLAFENGGSLFSGGGPGSLGEVNGEEVKIEEFRQAVDQQEQNLKAQYQLTGSNPALSQMAVSNAWNQTVDRILLSAEVKKLGMKVSQAELGEYLYGPNPPAQLAQSFTDPNTGMYDALLAKQNIDRALSSNEPGVQDQVAAFIGEMKQQRLYEKYVSLLTNSYNVPTWLVEKQNADNALMASASVVKEFYSNVPVDSVSNISDKEIADYIAKHKEDYKQTASRTINYVAFSALPTAADSISTLNSVLELKPEMDSTNDVETFITRNVSTIPYSDIYFAKSQLTSANMSMGTGFKDSILMLGKNQVFGPYLDGNTYVLAKMVDSKVLPDSVKCRHVLISTNVEQGGFDDSTAKRKIDSVAAAIKGGASWSAMVDQYNPASDGSRAQQGEMTFSSVQIQSEGFAPEFGKFILFDGKPGDRKVVKTSFGYHFIEIMSYIKPEMHYKIAYFAKPIETSPETDNAASSKANAFAVAARNAEAFDKQAESLRAEGINKLTAVLPPNGAQIVGVGYSRAFVRQVYEAKKGEVLPPELVGQNYVVAVVTDVMEEGTQSPATARPQVEPLLVNHKKAQVIIRKLGTITTLEAAAQTLGGRNIENYDSLRMTGPRPAGLTREPRVIGAAFNPANKGKVVPEAIEGAEGVYVVRVNDQTTTSVTSSDLEEQRLMQIQYGKNAYASPERWLRRAAKIKDNTSKFY